MIHGLMIALTPTSRNLNDLDQRSAAAPTSQFQPTPCLYMTSSRKLFYVFKIVEEKKNQKDILLHENHKIQISILISKFLLDTHSYALYPVYGYFYVTVAKLSSLNYLLSGSLEKSLLTLDLDTLKCLLASSICLNRGSDHLLLLLS
uniref:Uncharacterized protein n=1 Tax=Myotis myotis TaxID=51298 RepID=A0A7J7ZX52_MYOMY|nr:hypothetical protein mMyoMyo1_009729 [Myotis myotis]